MQNIAQEMIFSRYDINPMLATGVEGATGLSYSIIFLPILNQISCDLQRDSHGQITFCPYGVIEDSALAFSQIAHSLPLALFVLGYIFSTTIFNSVGIAIVKYTSATERSVISCLRILMVWLVSMFIGWETFLLLQVVPILSLLVLWLPAGCLRNARLQRGPGPAMLRV